MDIQSIVNGVRLCIDEEADNVSSLAGADGDDITKMNNIIKSKIGDALHWVCLHAPVDMLTGKDGPSTDTSLVADVTAEESSITSIPATGDAIGASVALASDFLRLIRVRGNDWHRAIMTPISEDSEEYLQLYDANGAAATADRPQAALILSASKKLEVYPKPTTIKYTYVKDPLAGGTDYSASGASAPQLPTKLHGSMLYYIAYLTLSAYGDARSTRMLEIAMQNLGISDKR